mmetsp:Transcript_23887/g.66176  ORF Transcript_23887/g.66176 Transcript_23887/m.66176 type:complete len:529 (-) Transcript_23887:1710-3296(-)
MLPLRVPVLLLVLLSHNQLSETTAFSTPSIPSATTSSTFSRSRSRSCASASSSSSSLRPNSKRTRFNQPGMAQTHSNCYYHNNNNNNNNFCKMVSDETTASSEATTSTSNGNSSNNTAAAKGPLQPVTAMLPNRNSSNNSTQRGATTGDIVTLRLSLTPEDGFVPEHLFDDHGEISLVLGWGNYLPGLHELLEGKREGDSLREISIDAGFGRKDPNLIIEVPKKNLAKLQSKTIDKIKEGQTLKLTGGITVRVLSVTPESIVVDANHPLAGSSYSCGLEVLSVDAFPMHRLECGCDCDCECRSGADMRAKSHAKSNTKSDTNTNTNDTVEPLSSPYKIGTFAMGCFWGVELAFMRTPGVVATRAGYTQGTLHPPSYSRIREGDTGHREAVLVVYDDRVVSYTDILKVYDERLAITAPEYFKLDIFAEDHWDHDDNHDNDNDDNHDNESNSAVLFAGESQYRHGIFYHDETQRKHAEDYIASIRDSRYCDIDLGPAAVFYSADDHHQQYLYKGGQAARKGCREPIRCYG